MERPSDPETELRGLPVSLLIRLHKTTGDPNSPATAQTSTYFLRSFSYFPEKWHQPLKSQVRPQPSRRKSIFSADIYIKLSNSTGNI
ncbi:hypothetical protein E2C01_074345 [Portunus trituberculatus]|uniref:Uncharacterized protein n=1 Tax=Portunus trituberculatus TaxID=210409 RepID=A0A5B7IDA7_PORTR|nr:hypothetical protein [Portunus trituberculatus]